ncbi:hypothetical protein A2716_02875 [candidate division WWE3 bacterium RIFCSPHIGHO2_01_FULL_40_23]|uniref:DUF4190 domain-containing protein n=1 Tax=candidate division WWE3 bacterium RIFCSPLOWO2_01_FULL_41_18 TaxID=1802625 RepID=A0A1F4VFM7_UNCKA|nr:MAG: hypothetical protein A2716_02875 [candidate division WWE3 bacterium RIFCSPHIGHO2_01_FULL_40_23]OGC55929.1 MAG: hypothetical protein A3A78_02725 [candidate division WWE3 bacterium RIFCSPLOWO2_01_FULL_41_18]
MSDRINIKLKSILVITLLFFASNFVFPNPANAAACKSDPATAEEAVDDLPSTIACYVSTALNILVVVSGSVFVLMVFYAAVKFSLSQGDPKGIEGAKATLTWAVIGFLVVIGVYVIFAILTGILGVSGDFSLEAQIRGLIEWLKNN